MNRINNNDLVTGWNHVKDRPLNIEERKRHTIGVEIEKHFRESLLVCATPDGSNWFGEAKAINFAKKEELRISANRIFTHFYLNMNQLVIKTMIKVDFKKHRLIIWFMAIFALSVAF